MIKTKNFVLGFLLLYIASCSFDLSKNYWKLAELNLKQGKYKKAIIEYEKVISFSSNKELSRKSLRQIAYIYDELLKDNLKAIKYYKKIKEQSSDEEDKLKMGWAIAKAYHEKLNLTDEALREYKEVFNNFAKNSKYGPEVLVEWAQVLRFNNLFEEEILRYQEFRKLYPGHKDTAKIILKEGQANLSLRDGEESKKLFDQFIKIFGHRQGFEVMVAQAFYGLGESYEIQDDLGSALEAYKRGLDNYPNKNTLKLKIERVQKRKNRRSM